MSYTWVRDMTKRYFGTEGQRITRNAEPEPSEWAPVIERVARGELSKRAARDELNISDTRVNVRCVGPVAGAIESMMAS